MLVHCTLWLWYLLTYIFKLHWQNGRKSSVVVKPFLGLKTETKTLAFRSRDRDRDLDKMNSCALESRNHGLEITTLRKRQQWRHHWVVIIWRFLLTKFNTRIFFYFLNFLSSNFTTMNKTWINKKNQNYKKKTEK